MWWLCKILLDRFFLLLLCLDLLLFCIEDEGGSEWGAGKTHASKSEECDKRHPLMARGGCKMAVGGSSRMAFADDGLRAVPAPCVTSAWPHMMIFHGL